jgi:hypothetical protein
MYGFRKTSREDEIYEFFHPEFRLVRFTLIQSCNKTAAAGANKLVSSGEEMKKIFISSKGGGAFPTSK